MINSDTSTTLPKKLRFCIGGFFGPNQEVTWRDGQLFHTHWTHDPKPEAQDSARPDSDAWRRFWEELETANVFQWPRHCRAGEEVFDGTQWELLIEHDGKVARSDGSNSYPFTDEIEPSAEFNTLLEALGRLLERPLQA